MYIIENYLLIEWDVPILNHYQTLKHCQKKEKVFGLTAFWEYTTTKST